MSPYEKDTIEDKLVRLREIIKILEEIGGAKEKDFIKDYHINNVGLLNLLLGATIILDVGQHLLSRFTKKTAREYKEVIKMLGEENIIPKDFSVKNIEMAKFRNLMVHDYDKVKLEDVYKYVKEAPPIFRDFSRYYIEFMDKQK